MDGPPLPPTDPPPLNQYYIIQTTATLDASSPGKKSLYLDPHLHWLRTIESNGILFLSGDMIEAPYTVRGAKDPHDETRDETHDETHDEGGLDSMYVIRAKSLKHAHEIAMGDPWNYECVRNFRCYPWSVDGGQVGVRVGLRNSEYRLE